MNLRQMDLNLLIALDVILEERNVTRAGERLFISQSTVSGILSRLRDLFDDEILVRVGRNFVPTPLALELVEPVRNILKQIDGLMNANRVFDPQTESLRFEIAATDYAVLILIPPLLKKLEALAPNVSILIRKYDSSTWEKVAAGSVDFMITPMDDELVGIESVSLFDDDWSGIVWAGNEAIQEGKIALDDFVSLPHLAFTIGESKVNSISDNFFETHAIERNIAAYTDSLAIAPFLLFESSMMSVVPSRLARRLQKAAEIEILDLPMELPVLTENLKWGSCFSNSPSHKWLREQIVEVAKSL